MKREHERTITSATRGVENVVAGWFEVRIPSVPKQRRRPYRKTRARRPRRKAEQ